MSTTRTVRNSALAIVAVSTLALAGCSSDDSKDAADDAKGQASAASETVQTETTVAEADKQLAKNLDVQAHRGGRGENTEESRAAFEHAISLGVDTLELDIVMSKDGVPVVWHDPKVLEEKCADTKPATEGDEQFPYVGKLLHELTFEQLQTLDCDKALKDYPEAKHEKGNKMIRLQDVFDIAQQRGWDGMYNIETKIEGEHREQSATPQEFVDAIVSAADKAGKTDKITIQSFDWRSLDLVKEQHPGIPTVALYDETTWKKHSPWIGAVDYDAFDGDALEAIHRAGYDISSPGYAVPYGRKADEEGYNPVATKEYVDKAHSMNIKVIPWTIDDEATMSEQIKAGVDGIITDYPTMLEKVAGEYGWSATHTASSPA